MGVYSYQGTSGLSRRDLPSPLTLFLRRILHCPYLYKKIHLVFPPLFLNFHLNSQAWPADILGVDVFLALELC